LITRKLIREGTLKARKMARKWYVSEESLKDYFGQAETDRPKEVKNE
jgi:hypothetical protein